MKKIFYIDEIRKLIIQYAKEEITISRFVEILNDKANKEVCQIKSVLSFAELVQNGIDNGANIVNGMPWSWILNGKPITAENNECYLIPTLNGYEHFTKDHRLIILDDCFIITNAPTKVVI